MQGDFPWDKRAFEPIYHAPLVLKARHLARWFCLDCLSLTLGWPEQAMGYGYIYLLGWGLVAEDKPTEFSYKSGLYNLGAW